MGKIHSDTEEDGQIESDLLHSSEKTDKLSGRNAPCISESKSWNLVKGGKPGKTLILNLIHSEACEKWFQELFVKRSHGSRISIPKHLVSLDEKYMKRCLELIHMNASKGASLDATKYVIDYPVDVGGEDLSTSSLDKSIVGSVMGSPSMITILKNPLFQKLGISHHDTSFKNEKWVPSDYQDSVGSSNFSPSRKIGKEKSVLRNPGFRSSLVQSGESMFADQSCSSSLSPSDSQGMLHCRWDGDIPHFSFSLDDQKELYEAHAWRAEMHKDRAMDYYYSFHLKPDGQRMFDISDSESDLIGKMKVSTSFSLSANNSSITETEFVMVDVNDNSTGDMRTLSQQSRRSRRLSKVMELFKTGHSIKQRTLSLFDGSNAIREKFSTEKGLEGFPDVDQHCKPSISENDFLPNLEMAAIVVKDRIFHNEPQKKEEAGGWGLKFLKKVGVKKKVGSGESTPRNVGDCSTSMDIIVPSGPHGGPKKRNGGPSSLIERWKLGGKCDCGGWDVGCPLKILKANRRREEGEPSSDAQGDCKSFDLFTEGIKQETPTLKMVTIHEGLLYFIGFQSSALSALQCFSIAVAIIHSRSQTLRRPINVQD